MINTLNDMPVHTKGLLLLLFPFLIQVGLILAFSDQVRRTEENQDLALHSFDVLLSISKIGQKALEANAAIRGYLLFSDETLVNSYHKNKQEVRKEIENLSSLVAGNEASIGYAAAIKDTTETLFKSLDKSTDFLEQKDTRSAFEEAASLESQGMRGKVMSAVDEFSNYERGLSSERKQALEARRSAMAAVVGIGFVLCALATLTANSIFSRNVSQRLKSLADKVEGFRRGVEAVGSVEAKDEIGEVDRAVTSLTRTLEARDREIELFIYSVSHDLRSPLINLEGFSAELERTSQRLKALCLPENELSSKESNEEIHKLLESDLPRGLRFIRAAVERLSGIINSLLYLSRVGRVPFSWTKVQLAPLLERVVNALQTSISEKGVEITVDTLPEVSGDSTALEQIFGNLLGNAVQYTDPSRRGMIRVFDATSIQSPQPGFVTIGVADNGLGIPDTAMQKLFVGFQRFHPQVGKGEGIGLAAVRRLVERHGGKISVESAVSEGTVFYIDLPIAVQERVTFNASRVNTGMLEMKQQSMGDT